MADCTWCGAALIERRAGEDEKPSQRSFCSHAHRNAFHTACRNYGHHQVETGAISVAQLRREFGKDQG